jgi:hypothetical protein
MDYGDQVRFGMQVPDEDVDHLDGCAIALDPDNDAAECTCMDVYRAEHYIPEGDDNHRDLPF